MRTTTLILLVAFLTTMGAARQQANQPPEPGARKSRRARQEKQAQTSGTPSAGTAQQAEQETKGPWKALQYRLVGPFRGGRVVAVSGVVGEPNTYYFGGVAGGVWKTTDGGLNWSPLTDKTKDMSPSIGAIAVAESDPNVIYGGTGEACIRGNIVGGNGVYKSIDAGKTWKSVGLADTHTIGRIIIDPKNPDRVFVAALGHPFADNEERGIFRTLDGGKTWQKVLYKDSKSGGIDIAFAPGNPNLLFAALWQVRRTPWSLDSGGAGSGLYRSSDGGNNWKELTGHGLPDGPLGRIGVTVSGADSNRVWAIIEAKKGGIYRSDDGGDTWHLMTDDHRFRQRAWYYSHIFADPKSEDTVYILNTGVYRSHDGGKTFARIPAPHGDNHGLWIDPNNPARLINGNDGGATISVDGGKSWSTEYNQPTAQFYHVVTDNRFPYYIYGAQQDNSTAGIASASPDGAIDRPDWYDVGGGESGYIAPDPTDPQIVYAGSYGGEISRYDHRTGELQAMNPWPVNPIGWGAADLKHRFQWTEPIVFSPHDPHTMYFAGEVLFKTTDGGMSWTTISPDLTRNDKSKQQSSGGPITKDNTGVEVYDTIFSVVESPVQKDLIWAGSDDGLVHLTRDGGQHWQDVTPKAMPEWGTVSMIEASPRDAGTAYMAVERHKMDDFAPYIFKTTDFGKTWT
ncbi:MAG TPA: glycosyl hydrolase, partial [Terriglobales bacterium]|nr:glycosyl hydrolase [Terriglobales bacterium]